MSHQSLATLRLVDLADRNFPTISMSMGILLVAMSSAEREATVTDGCDGCRRGVV